MYTVDELTLLIDAMPKPKRRELATLVACIHQSIEDEAQRDSSFIGGELRNPLGEDSRVGIEFKDSTLKFLLIFFRERIGK